MGKAIVSLEPEALAQWLLFPDGTKIVDVGVDKIPLGDVGLLINLTVESPEIPERKPGDEIPYAYPNYMSQAPIVFAGWGIGMEAVEDEYSEEG